MNETLQVDIPHGLYAVNSRSQSLNLLIALEARSFVNGPGKLERGLQLFPWLHLQRTK
jgi:hypothetical protein